MKKLLPPLLCYVLLTSQCFAAGPFFGSGQVSTIGSYSGVIRGVTETNPTADSTSAPPIPGDTLPPPAPGSLPANTVASNALGLFDLVVPGTGTASGAFLLFSDGRIFGGVIDASVDPSNDQLSGILNGAFSFAVTTIDIFGFVSTTSNVSATAVGSINAKISSNGNSRTRSLALARLTGNAFLQLNFGALNTDLSPVLNRILTFTVSGFKQTNGTSTSAVSALTAGTGQNGAGGSGGGTAGGSGGG